MRVRVIGRFEELPERVCGDHPARSRSRRPRQPGPSLTIALGYSGRDELIDACKTLVLSLADAGVPAARIAEEITRESLAARLYTAGVARSRPHHPHERRAAAERLPALAERPQRAVLHRRLLAGLPRARPPARAAHLPAARPAPRPVGSVSAAVAPRFMGRSQADLRAFTDVWERVNRREHLDAPRARSRRRPARCEPPRSSRPFGLSTGALDRQRRCSLAGVIGARRLRLHDARLVELGERGDAHGDRAARRRHDVGLGERQRRLGRRRRRQLPDRRDAHGRCSSSRASTSPRARCSRASTRSRRARPCRRPRPTWRPRRAACSRRSTRSTRRRRRSSRVSDASGGRERAHARPSRSRDAKAQAAHDLAQAESAVTQAKEQLASDKAQRAKDATRSRPPTRRSTTRLGQRRANTAQQKVDSAQSTLDQDDAKIAQDTTRCSTAVANVALDEAQEHAVDPQRREPGRLRRSCSSRPTRRPTPSRPRRPSPATSPRPRPPSCRPRSSSRRRARRSRETTLRAPISGAVATVDGSVGDTVSAGATAAPSSASSSSSAPASSGSSQLVLELEPDHDHRPGQAPGRRRLQRGRLRPRSRSAQPPPRRSARCPASSLPAKVIAIDSTATTVSNVVTYNVTFALLGTNPKLKPGMTADVEVVTAERDNALHVPTTAVTGSGANARVTVLRNGKQVVDAGRRRPQGRRRDRDHERPARPATRSCCRR